MKRFLMYGISKSLLIKIIIALLILLGAKNVFAAEFTMNNYTSATLNGTKNRYQGTEIYEVGGNFTYQFGNRYQGRLSEIETYFDYPFSANTSYRFTYNMATNDFNNNFGSSYWWDCEHDGTAHVFKPTYISYKKIQYTITPDENTTCLRVSVRGKNLSTGNITQISNWALSSITLYDPDYQSGSGGGQGSTPATPDPNQSIIENQNNNTQDIINNNNENTEDIITSIQETTESVNNTIIDTFGNKCSNILNVKEPYEKTEGLSILVRNDILELKSNNAWAHVVYEIPIERGKTYYFKGELLSLYANYVFLSLSYDPNNIVDGRFYNYEPYQAIPDTQQGSWSTSFSTDDYDYVYLGVWVNKSNGGNTAQYIKMTINDDNKPWCAFNSFTSKIDETTQAINQLNGTLTDDTQPEIDLDIDLDTNSPVSSLLTMPLTILNKVFDITDDTCTPYVLPFDFFGGNNSITFPCINLQTYLGNSVYNILDTILCFYIAYEIGMMCISIYEGITSLKDGFVGLYTPKHHDTSTRVGQGEMEGRYD